MINAQRSAQLMMIVGILGLMLGGAGQVSARPLKVFILAGQSNMVGHGKVEEGRDPVGGKNEVEGGLGSLRYFVRQHEEQYGARGKTPLVDGAGKWLVRDNVYIHCTADAEKKKGRLTVGFGAGGWIGPEFGFGHVVGNANREPVLIIKTSWGGKSLGFDFRPPSSGKSKFEGNPEDEGKYYREMIRIVKDVCDNLGTYFPQLAGSKIEIAGFGWHQGWNDSCEPKMVAEYDRNMANFIKDVRKDLGAPNLPFVIADTGMEGERTSGDRAKLCEIQMSFGDPKKHPEFAGTVASVETRGFARSVEQSPSNFGYHWNHNGESHYLIGEAMGQAMVKLLKSMQQSSASPLSAALKSLYDSITGEAKLTGPDISNLTAAVLKDAAQIGSDSAIARQAFDLVDLYEKQMGPLFINAATKGGYPRSPAASLEIHRALFAVQQALLDYAYTPENVEKRTDALKGKSFKTSEYFPGKVAAPANPDAVYKVQINASQPEATGFPVMYQDDPARRPTGCYLAPGSIGSVTVPESMVGKGFTVRVGAHSWDFAKKPRVKRLDRVSLVFPIMHAVTHIANPLGGGIYIEVPYRASAGIVTVQIANAVRSPFFSARSFARTSPEEWKQTERLQPGPWADFESDKFMMQAPAAWVRNLDDPTALMRDWDKSMDAVSELLGLPLVRPKTVLYMQNDVLYRGSANFPGYPMCNDPYNPDRLDAQEADPPARKHYMLRGPQYAPYTTFHELGHATSITKFNGETESAVNLLYVAVLNRKFGVDLDKAFARSLSSREEMTRDQAALTWMVTDHFQQGLPMTGSEMMYQHRGHAKYVDIAGLFGWEALSRFWSSVQVDYAHGIKYPKNADPTDNRILRMSKAANADLTPLIEFWGVHPDKPDELKAQIAQAGIKPSRAVYDRLLHYQSIIPMNHDAYLAHFNAIHPRGMRTNDKPLDDYSEKNGTAARQALQQMLVRYFPEGRP